MPSRFKNAAPYPTLYYGWVMVVIAAVAMALTLPGRTHGLGLVTKQLIEQTSLSQLDFAWINFWATVLGAAFCIPCGWLIDRYGVRWVLGAVLVLLGLSTLVTTYASTKLELTAAITLVRGFGQSMLSVLSITLVGRWFGRNLGPAMGVYSIVMSVLMVVVTMSVGLMVEKEGWQHAWHAIGACTIALAVPMVVFTSNRPQDDRGEFTRNPEEDILVGATLSQALRTSCFWLFALSISFFGMATSGLSLFQQSILEERGFDAATYHQLLGAGFLVGMVSNLTCGALARWVPMTRLLFAALLTLAVGWTLFPWIRTHGQVWAYTISQAAAGGALTVLFFAVWGHAFGRRQLGRIQGAAQMLTVLASAIGPGCVALAKERTGSYAPAFWTFAAVAVAFAVWSVWATVPNASKIQWEADESLRLATAET